jgi:hypothetical protein
LPLLLLSITTLRSRHSERSSESPYLPLPLLLSLPLLLLLPFLLPGPRSKRRHPDPELVKWGRPPRICLCRCACPFSLTPKNKSPKKGKFSTPRIVVSKNQYRYTIHHKTTTNPPHKNTLTFHAPLKNPSKTEKIPPPPHGIFFRKSTPPRRRRNLDDNNERRYSFPQYHNDLAHNPTQANKGLT